MVIEAKIKESDAILFINKEEDHFFDITSKKGSGRQVQKKCCAFANSDGGELIIGIEDKKNCQTNDLSERWQGFTEQEDANQFIFNIFKNISSQIENISFEFLLIEGKEEFGKVLKVDVEKSSNVHETSGKKVFIRKGPQCIEIKDNQILDLKLSKGFVSYENQLIGDYDIKDLQTAKELLDFLQEYSPKTDPASFLKKQKLIKTNGEDKPLCAGVLLYDENPSASIPKKCAIKISRYNTMLKMVRIVSCMIIPL